MRIQYLVAASLLLAGACNVDFDCTNCDSTVASDQPRSCPNNGQAGEPLAACNADGTCNEVGSTCIDGTCISCGTTGHVCCDQTSNTGCSQSSCVTGVEDFPTCENCGGVGMTCCTGTNDACQSGATCELATHVCKTDPNQGSGKSHFVALETQQHCALPQQYFTVSGTQTIAAQAQVLLVAANAGLPAAQQYILGPVDVVPTTYHVCRYGGLNSVGHIDVLAFSHGELSICEQSLGSISTQWAWQGPLPDADCPGSWASNMYPPNP